MRALLAFVAVASVLTFVPPAHAQGPVSQADHCAGSLCDLLNRFCHCLGHAAPQAPAPVALRCNGDVCDSVDRACKLYRPGWDCVASDAPSAPVAACDGCDAIIALCQKVLHFTCVEAAGVQPIGDHPTAPAPATRCGVSVCQDIDRICGRWGAHCLA
jgi:hypothetical protein